MVKDDVPCSVMSSLHTLLIFGALDRRRPETDHVALTRSTNLDIVNLKYVVTSVYRSL